MGNTLCVKKDRLPTSTNDAVEFLQDYFNEFEMECFEFDDCIQLNLVANQYTYCEDISDGLRFL